MNEKIFEKWRLFWGRVLNEIWLFRLGKYHEALLTWDGIFIFVDENCVLIAILEGFMKDRTFSYVFFQWNSSVKYGFWKWGFSDIHLFPKVILWIKYRNCPEITSPRIPHKNALLYQRILINDSKTILNFGAFLANFIFPPYLFNIYDCIITVNLKFKKTNKKWNTCIKMPNSWTNLCKRCMNNSKCALNSALRG